MNIIKLSGFIARPKKISDKLVVFAMSVGVKQNDDTFKNVFVECKSNKVEEVMAFGTDKVRVDVEGWVTGDFWEDKETGKERQKMVAFVNKVEEAK